MNTRKGFTLVELLVVIAILAILATVSVVGYTSFIDSANDSVALSELTQVRDYAMNYDLTEGDINGTVNYDEAKAALAAVNADATYKLGKVGDATVIEYSLENGTAYWYLATGEVVTELGTGKAFVEHVCDSALTTAQTCPVCGELGTKAP